MTRQWQTGRRTGRAGTYTVIEARQTEREHWQERPSTKGRQGCVQTAGRQARPPPKIQTRTRDQPRKLTNDLLDHSQLALLPRYMGNLGYACASHSLPIPFPTATPRTMASMWGGKSWGWASSWLSRPCGLTRPAARWRSFDLLWLFLAAWFLECWFCFQSRQH